MKMHIVCGLLLLGWLGAAVAASAQQLSVSPAYLEVDLNNGRPSGSFVITNVGDKELRCRAQTMHWSITPEGRMQVVEPDASSLAGWIKFNPKEFTFPPKSSQFVRYSIIPRGELQAGEYWGGIQFEPLTEQVARSTNGRGVSASIKVITSILVPIYGRYGDYTLSATIDNLEARRTEKGLLLRAIITNTCPGGLRIGGDYEITDAAGEQVSSGALTRSFILPRSTRIVKALVTPSLPPGVYALSIQVRDRKTKEALAAGNTSFSIAAPPESASK